MQLLLALAVGIVVVLVLRALSRGRGPVLDASTLPPTDESVRQLLLSGRKIEAIKLYRQLHGVGLREAKEAVERMPAR